MYRVDGPVGEPEVGSEVAEQVEAQGHRRQEIGPQPLVIEALVTLDQRRSCTHRVKCAWGDEVRAGLSGEGERKAAPDESRRPLSGRGAIGCEPIGYPVASRHCAWW